MEGFKRKELKGLFFIFTLFNEFFKTICPIVFPHISKEYVDKKYSNYEEAKDFIKAFFRLKWNSTHLIFT